MPMTNPVRSVGRSFGFWFLVFGFWFLAVGCWLPGCTKSPVWLRRGAERPADKGLRLFERLQSASSRAKPRLDASTAGCPQRSEGTQAVGPPFFGDLFFGETKKRASPAGAIPGLRPQQRACPAQPWPSPAQPSPAQPSQAKPHQAKTQRNATQFAWHSHRSAAQRTGPQAP